MLTLRGIKSTYGNDLAINHQSTSSSSAAIGNSQMSVATNLIGVVGLGRIIISGLIELAASISKIVVNLTDHIVSSGNLSQVQNHVLGIGLFVQNMGSLGQSADYDILVVTNLIVSVNTSSGLAIGSLGLLAGNISQGAFRRNGISRLIIGALQVALNRVRLESGKEISEYRDEVIIHD